MVTGKDSSFLPHATRQGDQLGIKEQENEGAYFLPQTEPLPCRVMLSISLA